MNYSAFILYFVCFKYTIYPFTLLEIMLTDNLSCFLNLLYLHQLQCLQLSLRTVFFPLYWAHRHSMCSSSTPPPHPVLPGMCFLFRIPGNAWGSMDVPCTVLEQGGHHHVTPPRSNGLPVIFQCLCMPSGEGKRSSRAAPQEGWVLKNKIAKKKILISSLWADRWNSFFSGEAKIHLWGLAR